ncbi:hypothetical protein K438DRAFT_1768542 [Mycena galopus ATCC 62051]|nr:hypothetical protein K438DRAFT_1768542 [Mycena galopus ATCC 62051]
MRCTLIWLIFVLYAVEENPLELVKESISALMMSSFLAAWLEHGLAAEVAHPTHSAEREAQFKNLCKAAIEIINLILHIAEQSKFTDKQLGWENGYDGGKVNFPISSRSIPGS